MTEAEIRAEIASLARRKDKRVRISSPEMPCVWKPYDVQTEHGLPFTEEGAWQFIADCVENNTPITQINLEKPPGEIGYVMLVSIKDAHARLYIKIQLWKGSIVGRSFHYSTESESQEVL